MSAKERSMRDHVRRGIPAAVSGLLVAGIVAVESCKATIRADNGVDIEISPDMTIHALGIEDALHQLTELYRQCIQGQFHRPCTAEEEATLERLIDKAMSRKGNLPTS
jgi:hypothetical protein